MPLELSWESFRDAYVRPGVPCLYSVPGGSNARVFVEAGGSRIGVWLAADSSSESLPASGRALVVQAVTTPWGECYEVATTVGSLFEQFFALARDIVARIEGGEDSGSAAANAIAAWRELLRERARLSAEEEVGLWGELWFLFYLLDHGHATAIDAWSGPAGDPHDFRFGSDELEVKTSTGTRRHHIISSLEQLVPSTGHCLRVLSILVGTTAESDGTSLLEMVEQVGARLSGAATTRFEQLLAQRGFTRDDADLFVRRFALRSIPEVSVVDPGFPVLDRDGVGRACGESAARIRSATYVVDVEGLGEPLGTEWPVPGGPN